MSYYVALLEMLRYSEKNDDGLTPYDILISQRPDLPHIKLNCANLDTIIPLIDASTGVMEYYVANNKLDKDAVHNTGEFTREELRAEPQYFMPAAYKELSNAVFPLSMPYHQPLDLIRTYLGQMQISRSELMKTFSKSFDGSVDTKNNLFFAEDLGLSETEFRILTQKKLDDSDTDGDAGSLSKLYGYPDDATMSAKIFKAEELLWQTGIKYTDLIAIVKARIINPDQHLIKYLEAVYKETGMKEKEFYDELTRINTTDNPAPAAAIVAALKVLDEDEKKFIGFVKSEFENFKKIVTLFSDDNIHNDLSKTHLKILKNVFENKPEAGVDNGVYSKINRFIRLWKKTGYTIEELDMLISAFQEKDITPSLLAKLAIFKKIKAATNLPVKTIRSLFGHLLIPLQKDHSIKICS
jgi:hypothetical protein